MGVKLEKEHWDENVLKSVETSHENKITTLWNQQVKTDRTGYWNHPKIIQKIAEQHSWKAGHRGSTENSKCKALRTYFRKY
jgi:hypothetical protein